MASQSLATRTTRCSNTIGFSSQCVLLLPLLSCPRAKFYFIASRRLGPLLLPRQPQRVHCVHFIWTIDCHFSLVSYRKQKFIAQHEQSIDGHDFSIGRFRSIPSPRLSACLFVDIYINKNLYPFQARFNIKRNMSPLSYILSDRLSLLVVNLFDLSLI